MTKREITKDIRLPLPWGRSGSSLQQVAPGTASYPIGHPAPAEASTDIGAEQHGRRAPLPGSAAMLRRVGIGMAVVTLLVLSLFAGIALALHMAGA